MTSCFRHNSLSLVLIVSLCAVAEFAGATAGVTYHGRLLKPDGSPVIASSVKFKLQIRTPGSENCLLYQEIQTKDLSASNGVFAITLNDGSAGSVVSGPFALDRALQNRGTFHFSGGECVMGNSYATNTTDGRRLMVEFDDGSGWEAMPDQALNHVPLAIESMTVGGFDAGSLLRVSDPPPGGISALTSAQHNTLLDLIGGTSTLYRGPGAITLSGDVTGTTSASIVSKIQGRTVVSTAPTDGQALVWNAAGSSWQPGTIATGGGAADWSTLTGKPASFPSAWADVTGKPSTFPSDWNTLANIPATFAPTAHSHGVNEITSASGQYFTYKPNGVACAAGEVLKWEAAGGGRWNCAADISATGGGGSVNSVAATAPVTVDSTDPANPKVGVDAATTSTSGVVRLASNGGTTAGTVVQADDSRLTNSRAPNGSAGGDLTGTYPNPTIAKLQTKDVTLASLASGDVLKYDGMKWVNAPVTDNDTLGGLSCANGQVALFSGTWTCTDASVTSSANSLVRRNGSGQIQSASANFGSLVLNNGGGSTLTLATPAAFTSYTLKLPAGTGTNGQVLASNGTDMVWSTLTAGSGITITPAAGSLTIASSGGGGDFLKNGSVAMTGALRVPDGTAAAPSITFASTPNAGFYQESSFVYGVASGVAHLGFGAGMIAAYVPIYHTDAGAFYLQNGSKSATFPNYTFSGNTNTGMYQTATNTVSFATNGVHRMTVSATGTVGIGTTTPAATLDVVGAIKSVATSNASANIDFSSGNYQYTSVNCGALTLKNMKSGSSYFLAVQGAAGGTCAFTAYSDNGSTALTVKVGNFGLTQTAAKHMIFSFVAMGNTLYVTSADGF